MKTYERPLPASPHIEKCLLGCLMLDTDGTQLPAVREILSRDAFLDWDHQKIFDAICELADADKPYADASHVGVAVEGRLRCETDLDNIIKEVLYPFVQGYVSSAANAKDYARQLARICQRRRSIEAGHQLITAGYDVSDEDEFDGQLSDIRERLGSLDTNHRGPAGLSAPSISELLAEPEERTPWIVDGLLPAAGFSLLAGRPKSGKTTFVRCCALAVARGEPFIGRRCHGGAVVYCGLEDKASETVAHFRSLGAEDEALYVVTDPLPMNQRAALTAIEQLIRERGTVLLVVDTLSRLIRCEDFNAYAQVAQAIEPIVNMTRTTGCAVLAVHHTGKSPREEGDSLGSTAFYGAADTALTLTRGESGRVLSSRQRYGTDIEPTVLVFDPATRSITTGGSVAEARKAERAREILGVLTAAHEPLTEREVRQEVGGRRQDVHEALDTLVSQGEVVRTGSGKRSDPFRFLPPPIREAGGGSFSGDKNRPSGLETRVSGQKPRLEAGGSFFARESALGDENPPGQVSAPDSHILKMGHLSGTDQAVLEHLQGGDG